VSVEFLEAVGPPVAQHPLLDVSAGSSATPVSTRNRFGVGAPVVGAGILPADPAGLVTDATAELVDMGTLLRAEAKSRSLAIGFSRSTAGHTDCHVHS
jgi:hypothetical protein